MTFLELAEKVLFEEKRAMTVNEIWSVAEQKGYTKTLNSEGKTPWATLGALIHVTTRDNPKSPFKQIGTRPKKFYLKAQETQIDLTEQAKELPVEEPKKKKFEYLEKDLHPYLVYYAFYHLHCYTKTINHSLSNKKEYGEWVHPDVVGCYFPFEDWKPEVFDLSVSIAKTSVKFISFELKRELSFFNLRESFFQTVSNSSWANESYLVAAQVSADESFRDELARLSTSFGIGVIQLNLSDPHSSEILYPAKFRDNLDWETINKLTMNQDFKEFLSTVKIDVASKKVHKKEYDQIPELESLKKSEKS